MTTEEKVEAAFTTPLAPGLFVPGEEDAVDRSLTAGVRGFQGVFFDFIEPGGPGHLLPGRPLVQQKPVDLHPGDSVVFALMGINGAFVTGNQLRERALGQFMATLSFASPNLMVCSVRLTDINSDDPIRIQVNALALFFQ
jgi:hypothetical protein